NTVAREENNIWNQNAADRIDFWFTQPGGRIGIELKCRTGNESSAVFVSRYLGDMTKCAQQPGVVPTTLYAVAVARQLTDLNGYQAWDRPSYMPLQAGAVT
ncbi:hypothetical protein ACMFMF_011736, partial [Clarireedia jacksonii]